MPSVNFKSGNTARYALVFVSCAAAAWAVFGFVFLALPILDIIKFFLFQIFAVVIPGIAIFKLVNLRLSLLEALTVSYGFGIGALIAVYFLFAPFHATRFLPYAAAVLSAASAAVLIFKRGQAFSFRKDIGELKVGLVFCTIALFMTAFILSASMLNPSVSGPRNYFIDTLNGVNFVTSASRGYPMQTLEMAGVTQYYHVFLYSYTGIMKLCTGISSFEIMTKYTFITISPLLAAGVVAIAMRILQNLKSVVFASCLVLLFPYLANAHYLYYDTIGFTLGLAFAVICVLMFIYSQQIGRRPFNRYFIVSIVFLLLSLGAKGPVSVSIMFGMCFCLLLKLIREKKPAAIFQGLAIAAPYFLFYFLLYRSSSEDSMSFSAFYDAVKTPVYAFLAPRVPDWTAKLFGAIYNTVWRDPLITIAFIAMLICALRFTKRRRDDSSLLLDFCLGAVVEGTLIMNLFKQMGSSEVYFLTCLWPFVYIGGTYAIIILLKNVKKQKLWASLMGVIIVPVLCYSAYSAVYTYLGKRNPYLDTCLVAGIKYNRFAEWKPVNPDYRRSTVTVNEYEGLLWLRDNTPQNSVIADGRYLQNNKYFCNTTFSERAFFVGGYGFITMDDTNSHTALKIERDTYLRFFFESEDENYLPSLAREGCTYLIISEFINPGLEISDRYCTEVFRNDDMKIYKFKAVQ
ncbi:MAG: hypothetical protein RSD35_01715 [Oscillospiraceae bacterium]